MNIKQDINMTRKPIDIETKYDLRDIRRNKEELSNVSKSVSVLDTTKQTKLISGVNIKTINNQSILGGGNIDILNSLYPVGSIYMSVNSVNPSILFGGTWEQIKDTFLLACGDTYLNGATGGSADAVIVEHTHETTTDGAHIHPIKYASNAVKTGSYWRPVTADEDGKSSSYMNSSGGHNHTISTEGESGVGKNMPPYLSVFMWQRIA